MLHVHLVQSVCHSPFDQILISVIFSRSTTKAALQQSRLRSDQNVFGLTMCMQLLLTIYATVIWDDQQDEKMEMEYYSRTELFSVVAKTSL